MSVSTWQETVGEGPLVAVAIHDGHAVRDEVARLLALSDAERLREEDPYTGGWTSAAPTRFVSLRSRFEVDLNRPRHRAVYRRPEDAWGLNVWKRPPTKDLVERSRLNYDSFYRAVEQRLRETEQRHGRFVVLDLHSYNHRRAGLDAPPANELENPQVNIGTGTMNKERWAPVVERLINDLRAFDFPGRQLDVRENVRFRGGNFVGWVHKTFPGDGLCAGHRVQEVLHERVDGRS